MVGKPSLGCAKTSFVGEFQSLAQTAGSYECIVHNKEVVGAVLRTRDNTAPIFVSAGHMIDLDGSLELALRCVRGFVWSNTTEAMTSRRGPHGPRYRLPEPTRLANIFVNALRRGETGDSVLRNACQD
jgi:deoxyribonuclease V